VLVLAPPHLALIGPGLAGDDVHEGGLARAIGPDDGAKLLLPISKDRLLIALNPSNETETESPQRSALMIGAILSDQPVKQPANPFGANSVTSTKPKPSSTCHQSTQSMV
jgi:expansin (peptidoglycan-binding protein)